MKKAFQRHKAMPFIFPAFTSTSTDPRAFEQENGKENDQAVVLIFRFAGCTAGSDVENVAFPVDIRKFSQYPGESEVLIPCFSAFRVLDVWENTSFNGTPHKMVVHLEYWPLNFMFRLSRLVWYDCNISTDENVEYQADFRREFGDKMVDFTSDADGAVALLNCPERRNDSITVLTSGSGVKCLFHEYMAWNASNPLSYFVGILSFTNHGRNATQKCVTLSQPSTPPFPGSTPKYEDSTA